MKNKWHVALVTSVIYWTALGIIFSLSYLLALMLGGASAQGDAVLKAMAMTGFVLIADDLLRMVLMQSNRWSKMGIGLVAMWSVISFIIPDTAFIEISRFEAVCIVTMPMIAVTAMIKYINATFQKRADVVAA
ncbi:hypothetical protein [Vibrio owensii]|uniref:hypothetical protein n=1 Tax=Vibrio harveyi group TaxID=717610 RepID=UPI003CC56476